MREPGWRGRKIVLLCSFHDDILRVRFSVIRDIVRAALMVHVKLSLSSVLL